MRRRAFGRLLLGGLASMSTMACSTSGLPPPTTNARAFHSTLSFAEARAVIGELRAKYGSPKPPSPGPVTSVDEIVEIIERDQLHRFRDAQEFADTLPGAEGTVLRATLEVAWADALATATHIAEELSRSAAGELGMLRQRVSLEGGDPAPLEAAEARKRDYDRLRDALAALGAPHVEIGAALAAEARRTYPNDFGALVTTATVHRLHDAWVLYDATMKKLEGRGARSHAVEYLRAMEHLERKHDRATCRAALEALTSRAPRFVRAKASLVRVQDDVGGRMRALEALEAAEPVHVVVRLSGEIIREAYAASQALDRAGLGG